MSLLILAALVTLALVALTRVVRRDGLGSRQPPRSHRAWWE